MLIVFRELYQYRELIWNLVVRNLKIRYKSSTLGFFWTLINPLFMMAIYLIFIRLMRFEMNLAVLLVGLLPWQFFIMCLNDAVQSITGNGNLVKKTRFPRFVLPLSIVLANLVNFLLSLVVLLPFLFLLGYGIPKSVVWLPLVIGLQFFLCLGHNLFNIHSGGFDFKRFHELSPFLLTSRATAKNNRAAQSLLLYASSRQK